MSEAKIRMLPTVLKIFFLLMALAIFSGGAFSIYWLNGTDFFKLGEKDLAPIIEYQRMENSVIYDRNGTKITELYSKYQIYRQLEEIPPFLVNAVLAVEDKNFFIHQGFDFIAIVRAGLSLLTHLEIRQGGSTITQQLVRNLALSRQRTWERKINELKLSVILESKLEKRKILEIYLNSLFLGNGAYGVGAAAKKYFAKDLSNLKPHEMALIAGLFQSPSGYNPMRFPKRAKRRQRQVLTAMRDAKLIDNQEARHWFKQKLQYNQGKTIHSNPAPYFIDYVREKTHEILKSPLNDKGFQIHTTLDLNYQKLAIEARKVARDIIEKNIKNLRSQTAREKKDIETSLLAIHPQNGEILAMYGGKDYTKSQFNRAVQALRSPGSAFKPAVYSYALAHGYKWSDLLYVAPVSIAGYKPKNYKGDYLTEATLLKAFYKSINTPVIEIGQKLGFKEILSFAQKLGISTPLRKEAGSLLGSSEVSMLDMARLYATIANNGTRVETIAIKKIVSPNGKTIYQAPSLDKRSKKIMSDDIAYLMTEGLRAVLKYGTAYSHQAMANYTVGKTGTSDLAKDNWFCGFSRNVVTITWTGTDDPKGFIQGTSAAKMALPVWGEFMKKVSQLDMPDPIDRPTQIESASINPHYGNIDPAGLTMYFLKGTTPVKTNSNIQKIKQSRSFRNVFDR